MSLTPEARAAQIEQDLKMASDLRKDAEEKEKKIAERMDADAGEKIDKILACLDSFTSKLDSVSSRMDAMDKARADGAEAALADKRKRKDAEEEEGESEKIPFRKDGEILTHRGGESVGIKEKGDPKELKADSYADSGHIYGRHTVTDAQRDEVAEIQTRADSVCSAWGNSADKPMQNELPDEYLRRTARKHQTHSAAWKEVNLRELSGQALKNAADVIFKDSFAMAGSNEPWAGGDLREVRRTDPLTGHRIREFYGSPSAWMSQFSGQRRLARFNLKKTTHD